MKTPEYDRDWRLKDYCDGRGGGYDGIKKL